MDNPFQSPAVISFCPGILGIERGLARAGVDCRVMAYVEIEAFIIANLVAGMEAGLVDPAPIWTDAKTFDARPFRGKVHGIIGGYPCPGESLAGLREGHLYKGFLWPAIRRAIAAARPLWCFFENVDDHLTGTYPIVQRSLRNMGYAIEAGVFSAEEAGAPHERQRLFILAIDNKLVNANSFRKGAGFGKFQRENEEISQRNYNAKPKQSGKELANTEQQGLEKPIGTKPRQCKQASKELADTNEQSISRWQSISNNHEQKQSPITRSGCQWPAGQGQFQYEWEEPRTVERLLGSETNGNSLEIDNILIKYQNDKLRSKEILLELFSIIKEEKIWESPGGPWSFLKEKVLFDVLLSRNTPQKLFFDIIEQEKSFHAEEVKMRNVRHKRKINYSSYRQKSIKQFSEQLENALCLMSYQIALAGGKEKPTEELFRRMHSLWDTVYSETKYVPKALSENKKIWKSKFDQDKRREIFLQACKEYVREINPSLNRNDLLRAYGNSVVEQTAEIAFIELMKKHHEGVERIGEPVKETI